MTATTIKTQVSPQEWQQRINLAACYRLVALYGWDDLIFTHISARVPGPPSQRTTGRQTGAVSPTQPAVNIW